MSFASLGSGILGGDDAPITTLRHNVRQWLPHGALQGSRADGRGDGLQTVIAMIGRTVAAKFAKAGGRMVIETEGAARPHRLVMVAGRPLRGGGRTVWRRSRTVSRRYRPGLDRSKLSNGYGDDAGPTP